MLYSKILVAYDGSQNSEKCLDSALKLVELNQDSKVAIICVYNRPTYLVEAVVMVPSIGMENDYLDQVTAQIKGKVTDLSRVHIEVRKGPIAKEILEYASEIDADLIVIGSRGLSGIGEFMLGSVSHNVVMHSKAPVLVIK